MRLGVSTDFGCNDADKWISENKKLELKSVVFPLNCECTDEKIKQYTKAASDAEISIAEVGIWRNLVAADTDERKANLKYSIGQLQLAEEIGARCCVNVVGAFAGKRWDGPAKENFTKEAWMEAVKTIQRIIDEVNPKNTYFTIEPMPWMIPSGPEEYLRLIDDVARDRFAVHMDIINMINCPERFFFPEEFMDKCFELLKGKIRSCHLKDVKLLPDYTFQLRECACGDGDFPIEYYAKLINREDDQMPVIIEHLHSNEEYYDSVKYVTKRLMGEI